MDETTTIIVRVKASSQKNAIEGYDTDGKTLMVRIKAPAEKNQANKELLKFLKKETGKNWLIKKGLHSKEKVLATAK